MTQPSGPKDRPFAKVFNALGAEVDLGSMAHRSVAFGNKPERIASILAAAHVYKIRGRASKHEAAALHGKIQFAGTQIFGKAALPAMRILSRVSTGRAVDKAELLSALADLETYFRDAIPRLLTVASAQRPIIIFTDGSSEGEVHQWGLLYFDSDSGEKVWAAGHVPAVLVDLWRRLAGQQIITQIELLPILIAKERWSQQMENRKCLFFIDNDAARDSLIRAWSDSLASRQLVRVYYKLESERPTRTWFARVASASNPADQPSRGEAEQASRLLGGKVDSNVVCSAGLIAKIEALS